jgi:hypothetical protein
MLSYGDCLGFCELTPEEIAAIARHEHLPEILALELGAHLCTTPEGKETLKRMVLDDIEDARPPRHDAGAGDAGPRPADATIGRCFPTPTPSRLSNRAHENRGARLSRQNHQMMLDPSIDGPSIEPI